MPQGNIRPKRGSLDGNTSESVRELICEDQREQRVQRLRTLVEDALASGVAAPDTPEDRAALHPYEHPAQACSCPVVVHMVIPNST